MQSLILLQENINLALRLPELTLLRNYFYYAVVLGVIFDSSLFVNLLCFIRFLIYEDIQGIEFPRTLMHLRGACKSRT